jgi:hypothetical protein
MPSRIATVITLLLVMLVLYQVMVIDTLKEIIASYERQIYGKKEDK